jgi:hypothetical protein
MNALHHLLVNAPLTALIFLVGAMLGVALPVYRMMRASTDFRARVESAIDRNPSATLNLAVKKSGRESFAIRLDTSDVQKACKLLRAGANLESVCRAVEQGAFRRAIEMMLKSAPSGQNTLETTSTKLG